MDLREQDASTQITARRIASSVVLIRMPVGQVLAICVRGRQDRAKRILFNERLEACEQRVKAQLKAQKNWGARGRDRIEERRHTIPGVT
jgi:hypothetical protein